jgi:Gram-negative bacterial TonB protein C-terminal
MKIFLTFLVLSCTFNQITAQTCQNRPTPDTIYQDVEQIAQYPGGYKAMAAHFKQFFPIPMTTHTRSWVIVEVVIDAQGCIFQVDIKKNPGEAEMAEKVRKAVGKMALWKPGIYNGVAVASRVTFPVRFCVEKGE